eukprot:CAMPEP_0206253380 /NCGR_PEP_ID=MMETSP0047_2-20121206/23120_1 /ASSEMBLY_ACC=CAM_ASM_000192 /TAXON_ID=195065 /ORGANISM="Chroomonas mesostigmatica_cf, Strain CCMP1168" /LENGTH=97 /DNA_ID=CAMNT_0053679583 /DNA_START=392 /DNA_END=685 /DNA_ORIENTATION=-
MTSDSSGSWISYGRPFFSQKAAALSGLLKVRVSISCVPMVSLPEVQPIRGFDHLCFMSKWSFQVSMWHLPEDMALLEGLKITTLRLLYVSSASPVSA